MIYDIYQQALTVQHELFMISGISVLTGSLITTWIMISVNRVSQYNMNYDICVNRVLQYIIIFDIWYLSIGSHSIADSSTHRNGHGPDSTVSVDETTTDSGIQAPGFAPEMSQVDENSQEEEGKWCHCDYKLKIVFVLCLILSDSSLINFFINNDIFYFYNIFFEHVWQFYYFTWKYLNPNNFYEFHHFE